MTLKKITLGILLLAQSVPSFAAPTTDIYGIWGSVALQGDFKLVSPSLNKFQWQAVYQNGNREDSLKESVFFGQVAYQLNTNASFGLGYLHNSLQPLNKPFYQESRTYQDFVWNQTVEDFIFTSRTRMEERINQTSGDVGYRMKQLVQISHALPFFDGLSGYVNNEIYFHLNQTNFGKQGFSENRVSVGLSYQFTPKIGGDLSYLEQYIDRRTDDNLLINNLQMNLRYRF